MGVGMLIVVLLLLAIGLGVLVVPLATMICGLIARSRGLSFMEFAVAGAMFGAFITGWIYVLARILNRSLPVPVMALVYIFPYTVWILVVTGGLGGLIANIWQYTLGIGSAAVAAPEGSILSATLMSVFLGLVAVVNIFSWTMSLRGLYHVYTDETPDYIQIPPI